ncbi:hypothetical protein VMCG_00724 [Cytospora schulzeri]|uniref:Uncharacterized protein n=1 Tax=Cytospora schulzeri TaxID=448051 RepID=A0A423X804_9PEZI|nr:hypothetical protein VMCG_00724 [Valsa malicola]
MAIRDTWNRIVRKSVRSSTSSSGGRSDDGHSDPTTAATPTPTTTKPTRPGLSQKTSWRSNHNNHNHNHNHNNNGTNGKEKDHASPPTSSSKPLLMHRPLSFFRPNHPMYRQMTEQNLQYQEALSTYTMQFGRSRPSSRGAMSDFSDISPCHSRAGSIDYGYGYGGGGGGGATSPHGHRRMSSALGPKDEER